MDMGHMVRMVVLFFGIPLVILPSIGGSLVFVGMQAMQLPGIKLGRCWKVYLAGCCYGFLVLVGVGFALQKSAMDTWLKIAIQIVAFCAMQVFLIPFFLRTHSAKAWGVAGLAVLVTNLVTFGLLWALQSV